MDLTQKPHRRFNPLMREWVLVSPNRLQRPWLGRVETPQTSDRVEYDPDCYLCPGNQRAGGERNPFYPSPYIFGNDDPALLPDVDAGGEDHEHLLISRYERGVCKVFCYSPRHDLTLPLLGTNGIRKVVELWDEQYQILGREDWVSYVQIFENRGAMMGASNPHPHCQIWANSSLPNIPEKELESFRDYFSIHHGCLLCDYLRDELALNQRIVCENENFVVVVPFWAVWPFETLLLGRRHITSMNQMTDSEKISLADILRRITTIYDNLFEIDCPYSMGFHPGPKNVVDGREWHFHGHYYPPLLRSATVQKFMVGYELLAAPQRDMTPETAAERLIAAGESHYLLRNAGSPA